jgi:hypothetical protein
MDAPNYGKLNGLFSNCNLSRIPSNSNFLHSICVNNVEVKTVKPGVFRHTLAGLQPDMRLG